MKRYYVAWWMRDMRRWGVSPRAYRAWPLAWPSPSGPPGRRRSPGSTARRRRVRAAARMRNTVEAGGADLDNARRSGPVAVTSFPRSAHLPRQRDGLSCCWRARHRAGAAGIVGGRSLGSRARSRRARRAAARKGASEAAAPQRRSPGEPPAAYGGPLAGSLSLGCSPASRCSRPSRQARRAGGAPLNDREESPHNPGRNVLVLCRVRLSIRPPADA
jgi:hypothetical protein